jgi:hypothetical protein
MERALPGVGTCGRRMGGGGGTKIRGHASCGMPPVGGRVSFTTCEERAQRAAGFVRGRLCASTVMLLRMLCCASPCGIGCTGHRHPVEQLGACRGGTAKH